MGKGEYGKGERRARGGGGKSRIVRKGTRGKREGRAGGGEKCERAWEGEYGKGERRAREGGSARGV